MHMQHRGPEIMASWLHKISSQLGFSLKAAKKLIDKKGLDSSNQLQTFTDMNVHDICNVMRKTPHRGQQVSVMAQENLKLPIFLFHHRRQCIIN